jgi:two-component system NtrC family sensor kinase
VAWRNRKPIVVSELKETERLRAECAVLAEAVAEGVLLLDEAGRIRHQNAQWLKLLGLPEEFGSAGSFRELWEQIRLRRPAGWRSLELAMRQWQRAMESGQETDWEAAEIRSGKQRELELCARRISGAGSRPAGWLLLLRESGSQRVHLTHLLQTEKMIALGQLVSGIAHELNNPLTTIRGYSQLMLTRRTRAERQADAERIYQEAERAGQIVRNLLLFARESRVERSPVRLNEVIERTLALRSYELKVENISVELQLSEDLPLVAGNMQQLQQVVLNLLVNAEQAILHAEPARPRPGHIRIRTYVAAEADEQAEGRRRVVMEVSDDGPGIPPELATRVFDPFFTTKPPGIGTGLGLSIVYGIVREHGGDVYLQTNGMSAATDSGRSRHRLGGACLVVELPALEADEVEAAEEPAEPAAEVWVPARGGAVRLPGGEPAAKAATKGRVLVVEDEATVAQLIADILREDGYSVEILLNPQAAVERVLNTSYDLVLCDLRMAEMDGRDIYRALGRAGRGMQERIAFMTGDTHSSFTSNFLRETGVACLAKPFLVEDLLQFVREAMARRRAGNRAATESESGESTTESGSRSWGTAKSSSQGPKPA